MHLGWVKKGNITVIMIVKLLQRQSVRDYTQRTALAQKVTEVKSDGL